MVHRTFVVASAGMAKRRVVVTGLGAVTPLGTTFQDSWQSLLRHESGATTLDQALDYQWLPDDVLEWEKAWARDLPCQVAAPVRLDRALFDRGRTARFVSLAIQAGKEALRQSKLDAWLDALNEEENVAQRRRVGVCIGSGMSGVREVMEAYRTVHERGHRRLSPHFVPKVLSNSAAGRLSIEYGLMGPNHSASTACAAGSHAVGDAWRCIQYDDADIMLAGGAEACIDPLSIAGFCRLRALSTGFDVPEEASRPFDDARDGFVMAEGAAILVLEEMEHAQNRGAPILAELIGYGLSADAHHITAPDPDGRGAEHAMRMALASTSEKEAGLLAQVDYINAHATSTPKGDEIEARVIDRVFFGSDRRKPTSRPSHKELWVSSTKGATGHLLGAAGALEAAFTVQSLKDQAVPPTLNLQQVVEENARFRHVVHGTMSDGPPEVNMAMSNSFGFGGTNASLLFRRVP